MYKSKVELEQRLLQTEVLLRNAHISKPYELNLAIGFYEAESKEYWKEYIEAHPDVIVRFFDDDDTYYKLIDDGSLEEIK